jgi:hypothetical protein
MREEPPSACGPRLNKQQTGLSRCSKTKVISRKSSLVPDSDEAMAKAALKEAFTLAIVPGDLKIKMANIRTVLDFTKSKPESKSKVTVETAEDWLKAAKADMENND